MSNVNNWMARKAWAMVFIVCGIFWALLIMIVFI
jgi:hypothetical protein